MSGRRKEIMTAAREEKNRARGRRIGERWRWRGRRERGGKIRRKQRGRRWMRKRRGRTQRTLSVAGHDSSSLPVVTESEAPLTANPRLRVHSKSA